MKKSLVFLVELTALVGLVSLTSCTKENLGDGTQFRASMEGCTSSTGKTILNVTALEWVSGDQIAIYGTAGCGIYSATPQTPATVAVFDNVSGETGNAPFRAYYPSTLTTDGVNVSLPATQTYVEGSINEFPMYAESGINELAFKNLCGVLKLHLTKASTSISSIAITAASPINGTFSVDYNGGDPELDYVSGGKNTTKLTCATPQSIADGKDFYIYLPEGSYTGLEIVLNTDEGGYCVKTSNTAINVTRSRYTLVTLGGDHLTFTIPQALTGLFSISATEQVHFAKGNLQYRASTGTWRFAEHQWDYVGTQTADATGHVGGNVSGSDNNAVSDTYNGWIDLFGWGTGDNPTLLSVDPNHYEYYGTFTDWGTAISSGNTTNPWKTLSQVEWKYVIRDRTSASSKRGFGTVNGVYGLFLLPDSWTLPTGLTFYNGTYFTNSYDTEEWAEMEDAGAVFLPAAGLRGIERPTPDVTQVGYWGRYWTSTPRVEEENHSCYVTINQAFVSAYYSGSTDRWFGYSVRLVRN